MNATHPTDPPTTLARDGTGWRVLYGADLQVGVAGFGDTPAAALADFRRAWARRRRQTDREPQPNEDPMTKKTRPTKSDMQIRLPNPIARALRATARAEGRSASKQAARLLAFALATHQPDAGGK